MQTYINIWFCFYRKGKVKMALSVCFVAVISGAHGQSNEVWSCQAPSPEN